MYRISKLLLFFIYTLTSDSFGQSFMGKSNLTLTLLHQRMSGKWNRGYSYQNIVGGYNLGFSEAIEKSNGLMVFGSTTTSLFNPGGKRKFYIGDYLGVSLGLGGAKNSTEFLGETVSSTDLTGHLGFLGGLTVGYSPTEEIDFGARWYYDFQWWLFLIGTDTDFNFAPFTRNFQFVARYKTLAADLTLGGYNGHFNSQKTMKYETLQVKKILNEKSGTFLGIRLDYYRQNEAAEKFKANIFALGVSFGWVR